MPKSNYPQSIVVNDPTTVINTLPNSTTYNGQGLWSQIQCSSNIFTTSCGTTGSSFRDPYADLYTRIDKLELNEKLLRLKILGLEGKFDKDEIANIRKMIMSEDEASKTLADSIIENA